MNTTISLQIYGSDEADQLPRNYFCSFKFTLEANQSYSLDLYRRSAFTNDETVDLMVTTHSILNGHLIPRDHYIDDADLRNNQLISRIDHQSRSSLRFSENQEVDLHIFVRNNRATYERKTWRIIIQ